MTPLRLACLNLARRPLTTALAVFSIALSVACAGVLYRLSAVSRQRFASIAQGVDVVVGAKSGGLELLLSALNGEGDYPAFLPLTLYSSLKAQHTVRFEDGTQSKPSFIEAITPFVYFAKFRDARVIGTDQTFPAPLKRGRWAENLREVVVGSTVARRHQLSVGDSVDLRPWAGSEASASVPFTICGILESTNSVWDHQLFSDLASARWILDQMDLRNSIWGSNVLHYFLIQLPANKFPELQSLINQRTVGQAVWVRAERQKLQQMTGTGESLGLFVTGLVLTLGLLSVVSMLMTRFEAMSLQLAVLRALGFRKWQIAQWLLWEGFFLAASACLLGLAIDAISFPFLRGALAGALPPEHLVPSSIWQSVPVWLAAFSASFASVLIPLYRVYRQNVHQSLRA